MSPRNSNRPYVKQFFSICNRLVQKHGKKQEKTSYKYQNRDTYRWYAVSVFLWFKIEEKQVGVGRRRNKGRGDKKGKMLEIHP